MTRSVEKELEVAAKALLRELLKKVRALMMSHYGLTNVSIRPIGGEGSRLSIPCKVSGTHDNERVPYFVKIIGSSDYVSALSIQFLKNLYLQMNSKDPLFDSPTSAEAMAKYQYEVLKAMRSLRIPSPKPFGYHSIDDIRWLLVAEFIEAKPLSTVEVDFEAMDQTFFYLKKLHDNKIFHGDIKPDNLMLGKRLYLVDIGRFRDGVAIRQKRSYDLVCLVCSFLNHFDPRVIIEVARAYYSPSILKDASEYIGLVQRRPDFYITDDVAMKLRSLMKK